MRKPGSRLGVPLKAGLLRVAIAALLVAGAVLSASAFPKDFKGFSGFGGADDLDQDGNRASLKHIPVILLHGNGGSAIDDTWGMTTMRAMLFDAGYNPSEVWAVSYLDGSVALVGAHRDHINTVRDFIEAVKKYLGVAKVDIIGHSLGATMGRAYLMGYQSSGEFDPRARRFDSVSTLVSLAGGNDGLGPFSVDEFQTGGAFINGLRQVGKFVDETPYGSSDVGQQKGDYTQTTPLDDDQIAYVALWASGDFVDMQHPGTGALMGANLNKGFNLGLGLIGHERIIKDPQVLAEFLPYLNGHHGDKAAAAGKGRANGLDLGLMLRATAEDIDWNGGASPLSR